MVNYCLLLCFFSNEINSYKFYGDNLTIHSKVYEIIDFKNIKENDEPELIFINNESYNFVDFFLKNNLTNKTKWLFIKINNNQQIEILYKEIRNYATDSMLIGDLIVLKNIKENFDSFYRKNFLLPIKSQQELNIETFFEFKIEKCNLDIKRIFDKNDIKLSKLLLNNSQYVYFGEQITEEDFDKCKMMLNMRFNFLFCEQDKKIVGYFCKNEYVKDLLIYLYSNAKIIEDILKFQIFKLNVPVHRIIHQ